MFIPFMESYYKRYRSYPKYPVGDTGYGNYDNCSKERKALIIKLL